MRAIATILDAIEDEGHPLAGVRIWPPDPHRDTVAVVELLYNGDLSILPKMVPVGPDEVLSLDGGLRVVRRTLPFRNAMAVHMVAVRDDDELLRYLGEQGETDGGEASAKG